MAAAILTTIATTQEIFGRENHKSFVAEVIFVGLEVVYSAKTIQVIGHAANFVFFVGFQIIGEPVWYI